MCGTNNHCATANKTSELKELKRGQVTNQVYGLLFSFVTLPPQSRSAVQ